jgi:hypothetical protein
MVEEEEMGLTFSDEDFERRYSSEDTSGAAGPSGTAAPAAKTPTSQTGRSPNRFMRTLLRRRMAASGLT